MPLALRCLALPWDLGVGGVAWKKCITMATVTDPLCCLSRALCSVHRFWQESARSESGALQNQLQLAPEQLPQTGRRGRRLHSAAFFFKPLQRLRVVHLARREQQPPANDKVFIERGEAEGWNSQGDDLALGVAVNLQLLLHLAPSLYLSNLPDVLQSHF